MPSQVQPTASVIGAGLAGLSSAIALRRAGWSVTLYERSQFANETGAAITVNPPAIRAFTHWNIDYATAEPTRNDQMIIWKADDLVKIVEETYLDLVGTFGFPSLFFHRADLHRLLLEAARGESGDGVPAKVILGRMVIGVEPEKGIVKFEYGEQVESDLVVVADGAHSTLNSLFTDTPDEAMSTGRSIFRFLIPMSSILSTPQTAHFYDDKQTGFRILLNPSADVLFMNYPCRNNSLLNCALVHPTRQDQDESDVWNSQASVAQALDALGENCHEDVKAIVRLCKDEAVKVHHAMKREPLQTFVRGRTCIIGDAAHVMLPTHAAGLTVAVESAAALGTIMEGVRAGDGGAVRQRLAVWDKLRNPRCNFVMVMSNAGPGGLNVPGTEEEVRKYYKGRLPPKEAGLWTEKSREVFLDCDAVAEAREAMSTAGTF